MEYLGLYNKPKAVVHPERKPTGPKKKKKKKEEEEEESIRNLDTCYRRRHHS